ncbi:ubiquinone/menaquinone biosynthesis C-methylase UbiE [Bacillus oleivorans]|uniref:Ubiquinone/menaquinone biosynthesis C-methylase UbiE n=1 Tax=Bacillus oleivorans TaxID=1448271 RepID=A0A285CNH3_9BACI|nr:class I SAM-dependent methyltransferase [Bacillus oleivorans]SNX68533.1 ubiquinone/menaquinone biosynthesis C-methylase UbiE [Bacillus oleivorans]
MPINFHSHENKKSYATRNADDSWIKCINEIVDPKGKTIVDIGCGGGIYTHALAEMGAGKVTGIDFSEQMIAGAKENSKDCPKVSFVIGNALDTKLPDCHYDIVIERALIHHIDDIQTCFKEVHRLLKPGGTCIIQDRTPDDCFLDGGPIHIRGYFFELFPKLKNVEMTRRHRSKAVIHALLDAGFNQIKQMHLWEVRKIYQDTGELEADLLNRTGRSILHELDNKQLISLVDFIKSQLYNRRTQEIIEKDRWTIWTGVKGEKGRKKSH